MSKSGAGKSVTGSSRGGPPTDSKELLDPEPESRANSKEELAISRTQSDESKFAETNQNAAVLGSGQTGFSSRAERRSNETPSSDEKFSNAETNAATLSELNRCLTRGMAKGADDSETLIRNIWAYVYSIKDTDGPPPTYDAAIMSTFLRSVESVIASEPSVITSIKGTVCVVGDLHGQADSLISLISLGGLPSPELTYVFLGNYTGEGFAPHETLFMLLAFKLRYPEKVYLLRGNNEDAEVLKAHKFPQGLEHRGLFETPAPWTYIQRIVDVLPLAALIKGQYFCVHGGIGAELKRCGIRGLAAVKRPPKEPQHVLLTRECQWAAYRNEFGVGACETYGDGSPVFGENDVKQFCSDYLGGIYGLIIRSRQIITEGVLNRPEQMMTVWSAVSFLDAFRNKAALLKINTDTDEAHVIRYKVPDKEPESLADIKPVSGRNAVVLTQ